MNQAEFTKKNKYPKLGLAFFLYLYNRRIIAFRTLREFFETSDYADSEVSLRAWYHDAKLAKWQNSNELKKQFKTASIIGEGLKIPADILLS